jgi:hypothetical protein
METIAVFFCKQFPEVVRKAQCNEPTFPETKHSLVYGYLYWTGEATAPLISRKASDFIDSMATNGYTVTAFFRLCDFFELVPFDDEFEKSVAMSVNKQIVAEAFPEGPSNQSVSD